MNPFRRLDRWLFGRFRKFVQGGAEDRLTGLYWLFKVAALFVAVIFGYSFFFNLDSEPGPWGDFIGGVLNPLLTFLTFMGLLVTIVIQQTELRETREEMRRSSEALAQQNSSIQKQTFDSTLNDMLALHNQIIDGITFYSVAEQIDLRGRHAFRPMYTMISDQYKEKKGKHGAKLSELQIVQLAYRGVWTKLQPNLGHYFRYLYNIIRYVKDNSYAVKDHMRVVRAQISDYELLILFYNFLTPQGRNFKTLAEELALLDNMPDFLFDRLHRQFVSPWAFGRQGPPTREAAISIAEDDYAWIGRREVSARGKVA